MERMIKILKRATYLLLLFALFSFGYFWFKGGHPPSEIKVIINFSISSLIFAGIVNFLLGIILRFLSFKNKEKNNLAAFGLLIFIVACFLFAIINTVLCCSSANVPVDQLL